MTEPAFPPVRFVRDGDAVRIELGLLLDDHVEAVWNALTQPETLLQWLAPGEIELRVGGAAKLNFPESGIVIDSTVSAVEPRRLLEYSWSGPGEPVRPLRWTLAPVGAATQLSLALTIPAGEDPARACAGWAAHLEMLGAALAGAPIKFPFELFKAAREAYREQVQGAA